MSTLNQRSLYPLLLCSLVMILVIYVQLDNRAQSSLSDRARLEWEERGQTTQLWGDDEECQQYRTRFLLQNSLPARALVSYPGSGNTWTRYLVEAATGIFTGSVFNNQGIFDAGHLGERREYSDGSTILQKTHHSAVMEENYSLSQRRGHVAQFGGRGVLVIRNPYKALRAYWNLHESGSQTKTAAPESLESEKFRGFVREGGRRWLEVVQDWLQMSTDCYVILYEVSTADRGQS